MNLSKLNQAQQKAVKHIRGPVLVLAGPGSGKTRTLTHRIAYLLEQGIKPESILTLTFTNKAAREMKERVFALVKNAKGALTIGTFHSVFASLLRKHAHRIRRTPNFVIYDSADTQSLLTMVLKYLGIPSDSISPALAKEKVSQAKNKLMDENTFESEAASEYEQMMGQIYRQYQKRLEESNALDFDDLVTQFVMLLKRHKDILELYQKKFTYILVDEYQDTNPAQYEAIKLLAQKHRNIFVVADDWQSIYSFRNADVENVLNFERDWKEATIIPLEENYRSTKTILKAAQQVIEQNQWRTQKTLWTKNEEGAPITIKELLNEEAEAHFVVRTIKNRLLPQGFALSEIAIFFRTNTQSRAIEEALIRQGTPYQTRGLTRFYERKEIKDIVGYLRILQNPLDRVSLSRIINLPARGIGKDTAKLLINNSKALETLTLNKELEEHLSSLGKKALEKFFLLYSELKSGLKTLPLKEFIAFLVEKTGYQALLNRGTNPEERTENIKELQTIAGALSGTGEETLAEFLEEIALFENEPKEEGSGVNLMTVHAAKGLEFPVVFITGLEYGIFPHYKSLDNQKGLEEERRLCYVAITRAQKHLFLTHTQMRRLYGRVQANPPSNFLDEIPIELIAADTID